MKRSPRFPIYIPSKGRYNIRYTSDFLSRIGVFHYLIVEKEEYELYYQYTKDNPFVKLLILDKSFQENYETLDNLGLLKPVGPGAARNFAWEHSIKNGFSYHWVMDDNIRQFIYLHENKKITISDGTFFYLMEDFVLRFKNLLMAGPHYAMFVPRKQKYKPFFFNTRIYSCNLIKNDIPFRWRGRYNEDTILSLDILSKGYCTLLFNYFLQEKIKTQLIKGGNTEVFYKKEGTFPKSQLLVNVYPQYAKLTYKFQRIHHEVNYKPFKNNKLLLNKNYEPENLKIKPQIKKII